MPLVPIIGPSSNFATQSGPHVSGAAGFGPTLMKSRAKLPFESRLPQIFVDESFPEGHTNAHHYTTHRQLLSRLDYHTLLEADIIYVGVSAAIDLTLTLWVSRRQRRQWSARGAVAKRP